MPAKRVTRNTRRRAIRRSLVFGGLSLALYTAVFTHTELLMTYFTKGGLYTLLPVTTVFIFSYIHGSLASNVWTALGVVASSQVQRQRPIKPVRVEPEVPRPRARLSVSS